MDEETATESEKKAWYLWPRPFIEEPKRAIDIEAASTGFHVPTVLLLTVSVLGLFINVVALILLTGIARRRV